MLLGDVKTLALDTGLSVLPEKMDSAPARAMLLAIGMQESRFQHRKQIRGPANGYWMFERIGIQGVMQHPASRGYVRGVMAELDYTLDVETAYTAVEHNDPLACAFARLLLWTYPESLPGRDDPRRAWDQYLSTWRPGKPHPETFEGFYERAWDIVSPKPKTQFAAADMDY